MIDKLTLRIDEQVIENAKKLAEETGISLSKLTELFFIKATEKPYTGIEDFPIAEWVKDLVRDVPVTYSRTPPSNKELRAEAYEAKHGKG